MAIGAIGVFLLILSAFGVQLRAKIAPYNYGSNTFFYLHSLLITELFWQIHQLRLKRPKKIAKLSCKNKTPIPKQLLRFLWHQLLKMLDVSKKRDTVPRR